MYVDIIYMHMVHGSTYKCLWVDFVVVIVVVYLAFRQHWSLCLQPAAVHMSLEPSEVVGGSQSGRIGPRRGRGGAGPVSGHVWVCLFVSTLLL